MALAKVNINQLKITHEDEWLEDYVRTFGADVATSPNYLALRGNFKPLKAWFEFRGLDWEKRMSEILDVFFDVLENGQNKPIKIYSDFRINDGHKRSACLLALGYNDITAEFVGNEEKL